VYAESAAGRPGADHGPWGRERELATVGRLFDGGSLRAVLLEGEAGIGKSAVWAAGLAEAYRCGYTVLSATGSEAETGLSYTGLTDLFEKVADEVLPQLPDLQREPLEVALLRRAPAAVPTGQREVSVAALGALRLISERGPVLVAVDDLQWVDRVSVEALAFALRRPGTESVRLLAAARLPGGATAWSPTETEAELSGDQQDRTGLVLSALPSDAREVIRLEPLATSVIDRLLTERLGQQLPRNVLTALVERTAGNPFWSLEVGAALARDGVGEGALPVPESLSALVAGRLATLSTPVRDVLLVVSALSHPTTDLAYRALGMKPGDAGTAIDEAIAAGVVTESESRLRPEHPLLGSAALDSLLPGVRVALHRRLAEAVDDPEQHARHLVLAANNSGPELLAALDAGVRAAKSRGATSAAAELSELAVRYTPHTEAEGLQQRRMEAAELLFTLGQTRRAHDHLVAVYASYPTPLVRRRVLPLLVETTYWLHSPVAAADLVREAIDSSQQDPYLLATAYALGADVGDGRGTDRVTLAERALAMFDELGEEPDPRVLATALTYLALARLDAGDGISYDLLERAERAERQLPWVPITLRASYARQIWLKAVDEVDACVRAMRGAVTQAQLEGDEFALAVTYGHLALAECWAGRYALATEAADRGFECAGPGEARPAVLYGARGLLLVLTGDTASARALMTEELAVHGGGVTDVKAIVLRQVLGAAALVEGDVEEAVDVLSTALRMARAEGIYEPGRRQRLEGDLGQVLVATGRLAEATDLAAELRALGERAGRPAVLGVGLRIEGLVRAAEGDLGAAQDLLEQAVRAHEQSQLPLERGRSLLALGQVQRRLRSKVQAKQSLQAAFDCFTELGATPFVELAAAELDRIEPARGNTGLTRAEQRIVDLVAAGHSNREIAAELFVSVRTVETHLGSVYRKLSIRSRTELVRRFAGG
jgi:DNA-binding CsgD family transcriptional regulator